MSRTLKDSLYLTIHRNRKRIEEIAEDIGISASYLYRSALPTKEEMGETASGCRFPLDKLIPLIRSTGDFLILDYLEKQLGRVGLKVPQSHDKNFTAITKQTLAAVHEFGNFVGEIDKALDDDLLEAHEIERIDAEAYRVIQAIMALVAKCKAVEDKKL